VGVGHRTGSKPLYSVREMRFFLRAVPVSAPTLRLYSETESGRRQQDFGHRIVCGRLPKYDWVDYDA